MADAGINLQLLQLSALIGTGLPVVAAVVKQDRFSQRHNTIIAAALTVVTALIATAARHEINAGNLFASFTVMYTTAVAFHHGLWKPTGLAPAVQRRTSRRRPALSQQSRVTAAERVDLARC
ncbi:MAG: hypothetical protein QOE03_2107 [Micromonosporaceae bacterium]|nr:hypothetical protein [Micromonosporaceae bacterium]